MRRLLVILTFALTSCLKLDSNLYNLGDEIKEYKLDSYDGEQDFKLDDSYNIPPSMLTAFVVESRLPDEETAKRIHCLYIGDIAKIATDTVILYCHGNKWHMDFYWQRAKLLAHVNGKNRYGVLMMDYRGYGLSEGEPSEEGIYTDVDACIAWLKERGLKPERFMIYGFSLGSAPACELTATPRTMSPSKLILEAPFGSAAVMVQDASQLNMPPEYFTDLEIDNAEEIRKVTQPLLWVHGLNDNFLSYRTHGELVFNNHAGLYKEKHLVEGADHGQVPEKMGFEIYLSLTGSFIRH